MSSSKDDSQPQLTAEDETFIGVPLHSSDQKRTRFPLLTSDSHSGGIAIDAGTECVREIKYISRGAAASSPFPNLDKGTTIHYCDDARGRLQTHLMLHGMAPIRVLFVNGRDDYDRGLYAVVDKENIESDKNGQKFTRFVLKKVHAPSAAFSRSNSNGGCADSSLTPPPRKRCRTNTSTSISPLRAIHTEYRNHKFRSRLEARHAQLYDALNVAWTYERTTITLQSPRYGDASTQDYTPDFELHGVCVPLLQRSSAPLLVEVKPTWPHDDELRLCEQLCLKSRRPLLLAYGRVKNPHARNRSSSYDHSNGLRFFIFDEHGARRCSDAVLLLDTHGSVLIDVRRSVDDDRVYHPRLLDAFASAL